MYRLNGSIWSGVCYLPTSRDPEPTSHPHPPFTPTPLLDTWETEKFYFKHKIFSTSKYLFNVSITPFKDLWGIG